MKWVQPPATRVQPSKGTYKSWKNHIAKDCSSQCVYCAVSESRYGGIDNFHVEHFRPKSKFAHLRDIITNLYLACGICNRFKSNDWPAEPQTDHSTATYPDPSAFDYNFLFTIDFNTYEITGQYVAARYVAERLFLNRPQLLRERRLFYLEARLRAAEELVKPFLKSAGQSSTQITQISTNFLKLVNLVLEAGQLYRDSLAASPYDPSDIKRLSKSGKSLKKPKSKKANPKLPKL